MIINKKRRFPVTEKTQLILMAKYNQLMNQRMIDASANLSPMALAEDKGAFFKSVIGSLNHIMVGDILWMKRFANHPDNYQSLRKLDGFEVPAGLTAILFDDLSTFAKVRAKLDDNLIEWCDELNESDLDTALRYQDTKGVQHAKRFGDMILHLFLHQIHHRGQITTLLSQESIDFGDTDLPEIVPERG
jgi:uncharacterized damage-inducible protein DinB